MTPATTNIKAYQAEAQYQARTVPPVVEPREKSQFLRKLENGINWFSRNMTGQQKISEKSEL
ncbi:MAG TPA: hypothetical protein VH186_20085 [Chloroflexia bacterium]|nr:hypothetical protein [Chloroflexia bacterium]